MKFLILFLSISPSFLSASSPESLVYHPIGYLLVTIFIIAYYFILNEDTYTVDKSKISLFAGTFLFLIIGAFYSFTGRNLDLLHIEIKNIVFEISNIIFFLFVAMTYIQALIDRNVFEVLRCKLVSSGYNYKKIFWLTGIMTFLISPIADNLTTALIMSTVLITITKTNINFLVPSAINIVVASNAGGAWSPFGDITTLMAWTSGKGEFIDFLFLFPASIIGYLTTAYLLSRIIPNGKPDVVASEDIKLKKGAKIIMSLGIFTILSAVLGHQLFQLPIMWGMMFGLSVLSLYSHYLKKKEKGEKDFDVFHGLLSEEHDTLFFFFGILAVVGALGFVGYLVLITEAYTIIGATSSNIIIGIISAVIDNVPLMSAILKASPDMGLDQWMLATLAVGIGGSLISFGSAAGVGVMGKLKGIYTVKSHFKYAWMVTLGYMMSMIVWYVQYEVLGFYIKH